MQNSLPAELIRNEPDLGITWSTHTLPRASTWNASDKTSLAVLSNGNLTLTSNNPVSFYEQARNTFSRNTGKFYVEFTIVLDSVAHLEHTGVGVGTAAWDLVNNFIGGDAGSYGFFDDGTMYYPTGGGSTATGIQFGTGDVVRLAVDLDAAKLWVGVNGTWYGDPETGVGEVCVLAAPNLDLFVGVGVAKQNDAVTVNLGQSNFVHPVPSGFKPWGDRGTLTGTGDIAYANGKFMFNGDFGNTYAAFTTDGVNFTPKAYGAASVDQAYWCKYGNGVFITNDGFFLNYVVRTADEGATFTKVDTHLTDMMGLAYVNGVWIVTPFSATPDASALNVISRSIDDGLTWITHDTGAPADSYMTIENPSTGSVIIFPITDGSVRRSFDGGLTWNYITWDQESFNRFGYATHADGLSVVANPTNGNVYVSIDDGSTWHTYSTGVNGAYFIRFTHGKWYVIGSDPTFGVSTDGCKTWSVEKFPSSWPTTYFGTNTTNLMVGALSGGSPIQNSFRSPGIAAFDPYGTDAGSVIRDGYHGLNVVMKAASVGAQGCKSRCATLRYQGKYYCEFKLLEGSADNPTVGVSDAAFNWGDHTTSNNYLGGTANSWGYFSSGNLVHNTSTLSTLSSWSRGDVIGVVLDFDAGKGWFSINGIYGGGVNPVGNPASGSNPAFTFTPNTALYVGVAAYNTNTEFEGRFYGLDFTEALPTGFSPWGGPIKKSKVTWDASTMGADVTLSEGGLSGNVVSIPNFGNARSTIPNYEGKYYLEVEMNDPWSDQGSDEAVGFVTSLFDLTDVSVDIGGGSYALMESLKNNDYYFPGVHNGEKGRITVKIHAGTVKVWTGGPSGWQGDPDAETSPFITASIPTLPATWSPVHKKSNITLSGGNLVATHAANGDGLWGSVLGITGLSSGKAYAEYQFTASGDLTSSYFGVADGNFDYSNGNDALGGNYFQSWAIVPGLGVVSQGFNGRIAPFTFSTLSVGDWVGVAVDFDAGKIWFRTAAGWVGGGNPATGTGEAFDFPPNKTLYLAATPGYNNGDSGTLNAGGLGFQFSIPAGFSAWNSFSVPTPIYVGMSGNGQGTFTGSVNVNFGSEPFKYEAPSGALAWDGSSPRPNDLRWDSTKKSSSIVLSNDDATATSLLISQASQQTVLGNIGHSFGKHGFRVRVNVDAALGGENVAIGLAQASFASIIDSAFLGFFGPSVGLYDDGIICFANGSSTPTTAAWSIGGVITILYDADAGLVWVGKDGIYDGDPAAGTGASATVTPGTLMFPAFGISGGADMQVVLENKSVEILPTGFTHWGQFQDQIHWDLVTKSINLTLSNNNLTGTTIQGDYAYAGGSMYKNSGKLYMEFTPVFSTDRANDEVIVGVTDGNPATNQFGLTSSGNLVHNGGFIGPVGIAYNTGEVVGVAINQTTGKGWFRNAAGFGGDPVAGTGESFTFTPGTPLAAWMDAYSNAVPTPAGVTVNFGAIAFAYSIPTGFSSWK